MRHKVEVVPYDAKWPQIFEKEALAIRRALGPNCVEVHHIGSTAVPGLSAKPIIDILPVVKNILEVDQCVSAMERLGYEAKGEFGIAFRRYFQKGSPFRTHHVHVFEEGDPEISRYLKFRDWMRIHEEDAKVYARLKEGLAEKFPDNMLQYCFGKDAFVANIDAKDGYTGWRMVKALTDREWEAVRKLRRQHSDQTQFDSSKIEEGQDHIHFVFYKNADIVGYVYIHLQRDQEAALKLIVIDERHRGLGLGSQFLKLCERWLSHQGIKKMHVDHPKGSCGFMQKQGY